MRNEQWLQKVPAHTLYFSMKSNFTFHFHNIEFYNRIKVLLNDMKVHIVSPNYTYKCYNK